MPNTRLPAPKGLEGNLVLSAERTGSYEEKFAQYLVEYIKSDNVLQHFLVRLAYECEAVQKVIRVANEIAIDDLESAVNKMARAKTLNTIAIYDAEFHQRLFAIAGEKKFFDWWRLQSEALPDILANFWRVVGYRTEKYDELMELHKKIFEAIRDRRPDDALDAMERHFASLLLYLLGGAYQTWSEQEKKQKKK